MPYYEYRCPQNGRTVEVRHSMSETVETWGDLCARAEVSADGTPVAAPVERLMSAPVPLTGRSDSRGPTAPCGPACGCMPEA